MRTNIDFKVALVSLIVVTVALTGCAGSISSSFGSTSAIDTMGKKTVTPVGGSTVATTAPALNNSPYTRAAQGFAVNGNQAIYMSSNYWLTGYDSNWTLRWSNMNALAGLPSAVTHIGDADFYSNKLIAPVENFVSCDQQQYKPVLLAVYDATSGLLLTWSDITADMHEASSVTVVPEKNQLVVSDFCDGEGESRLWVYDLRAVLNNAPGAKLRAINIIHLSTGFRLKQGISWSPAYGQFLVSADINGPGGSLWWVAPDGTVSGPGFILPQSQTGELEGCDFSTGNVYYLMNGYVYSIGPPPAMPAFNPMPAKHILNEKITITAGVNAEIHYTLDGSIPTAASPLYTEPIHVRHKQTLNAIAIINGTLSSPMTSAEYKYR